MGGQRVCPEHNFVIGRRKLKFGKHVHCHDAVQQNHMAWLGQRSGSNAIKQLVLSITSSLVAGIYCNIAQIIIIMIRYAVSKDCVSRSSSMTHFNKYDKKACPVHSPTLIAGFYITIT